MRKYHNVTTRLEVPKKENKPGHTYSVCGLVSMVFMYLTDIIICL